MTLPTKRQVLRELQSEIASWRRSYRQHDGVVRDRKALHTIRCLEVALLVVKEWKFPK